MLYTQGEEPKPQPDTGHKSLVADPCKWVSDAAKRGESEFDCEALRCTIDGNLWCLPCTRAFTANPEAISEPRRRSNGIGEKGPRRTV